MHVIVNAAQIADLDAELVGRIESDVETALDRFAQQLTRVEIHLGDDAAGKSSGSDIRCTLEARPAGQGPVAVTEHAATVEEAVAGATDKVHRLLESRFGRLDSRRGTDSIRHLEVDEELT